jgi:hypothetical protein
MDVGSGSVPQAGPGVPAYTSGPLAPSAPGMPRPDDLTGPKQFTGNLGPSEYICYPRPPGIAGPVGGDGPIGWEIYLRNGFSFAVGGNYFGRVLGVGWDVEGGVRSTFFNPAMDAAWFVELGLGNINNDVAEGNKPKTLLNIANLNATSRADEIVPSVDVTVKGLNRTYASVGLGKEWYVWGSAESDGKNPVWRVGADCGGRYGTEKLEVNELPHRTDTIAMAYVAAHTDLEIPFGPGFFQVGVRTEWSYCWSDVLQRQNNSDIQDVNLLFTVGYRY